MKKGSLESERSGRRLVLPLLCFAALSVLFACVSNSRRFTVEASNFHQPVLFVVAGIHGDEPSGLEAARLIEARSAGMESSDEGRGSVSLIVLAEANFAALAAKSRVAPGGRDMNRLFPGDASAGGESARAAEIFRAAMGGDLVLDLHEEGYAWAEADLPTLVVSAAAAEMAMDLLELLAERGFHFAFTGSAPEGSLVGELAKRGKAALGVEVPARFPEDERIALHLAVFEAAEQVLVDRFRRTGTMEGR